MTDSPSIAGRYRLISRLGEGGMGVTYRAWDTRRAVPVVVKMPKQGSRAEGDALQRFAREIEAMLGLLHDHIVPILDHGEENGCPFVVMRFLPGGSLGDLRRRDVGGNPQTHPPGLLHNWLPTVASALDFIHDRGVLHRDVKPGNVFFDGFWNAFLGDFGIAKVLDDSGGIRKDQTLTDTRIAIGTPEYMAPEMFLTKAVPDGRSDQYALAVTVYEMLSGRRPFTGSKAHIIVEHSTLPVPPLDARSLKLPPSLCAAIEKALAKRPEDRFQTCGDFVSAALRDVLPMPREPDVARLLCPNSSCSMILRLPTSAGGKEGKCPYCRSRLRIAADISALWLGGEEEARVVPAPGDQPEPAAFEAIPGEAQLLVGDVNAFPIDRQQQRARWRAVLATLAVIAAVVLPALATLVTHSRWQAHSERQLAALTAEHAARSQAAEAERQKKMAAAEERIAALTRANAEAEVRVRELQDDVSQLEAMVDESEAAAELARSVKEMAADEEPGEEPNEMRAEVPPENTTAEEMPSPEEPGQPDSAEGRELTLKLYTEQRARARGGPIHLNLRGYSSFSPHVKAAIVTSRVGVEVTGVQTLTDAQIKALALHKGNLSLDSLTTLSDEAAQALARRKYPFSLKGLVTISDAQAQSLAQHKGNLSLDSLTTLSDEAAQALARRKYPFSLNGLTTLSDEAAKALAEHEGTLNLRGLTTLTDEVAKALAKQEGLLDLNGLTTLTVLQASALAQQKGFLSLDGLTTLSDAQVQAFAQHKGGLTLNGLTALSDAQAQAFAQHKGDLTLNGLTTLSDAQAQAFAQHEGDLTLNGLTTLSDAQVQAFAQRKGNLSLDGLTALTVLQASALAQQKGFLSLDGLTTLSDAQVQAFAQHEGGLTLNGLTTLSDAQVQAFAQHKGWLTLDGLTALTVLQASALAQHEGYLFLNGLTTLSDEAALALAQKKGEGLHLLNLTSFSDKAIGMLHRNPGITTPARLRVLSQDLNTQEFRRQWWAPKRLLGEGLDVPRGR